jgi:hypothetical protein
MNRLFSLKNWLSCLVDPSLYIFQEEGLIFCLVIYVEDLLFISSHNAKLEWVHDEFCFQFYMSMLRPLSLFMGA